MKHLNHFFAVILAGCFLSLLPAPEPVRATEEDFSLWDEVLSNIDFDSTNDIDLRTDNGYDYTFTYHGEDFRVLYQARSWKIYDSWKIMNPFDILHICTVLSEEHPVPSRDYTSWRTPSDMAYEWVQHNLAYLELPEGNAFRNNAKNVDLDPRDQGRTFQEFYQDRTGKDVDSSELISKAIDALKERLFGE